MNKRNKASISAATTTLIAFWLFMIVRTRVPPELSRELVLGVTASSLFLWLIALLFSEILLIPLTYVFKHVSRKFSLLLFSIIGFIVPASLQTLFSMIPAHGETPPLYGENNEAAILGIISIGVIGAASAIAAWWSLRNSEGSETTLNQ